MTAKYAIKKYLKNLLFKSPLAPRLKEHEANKFAADTLIPPAELAQFVKGGDYGEAAIRHLASKVGIAPGIVAGRLQHEGKLEWNECNDLKVRLTWGNGAQD